MKEHQVQLINAGYHIILMALMLEDKTMSDKVIRLIRRNSTLFKKELRKL